MSTGMSTGVQVEFFHRYQGISKLSSKRFRDASSGSNRIEVELGAEPLIAWVLSGLLVLVFDFVMI